MKPFSNFKKEADSDPFKEQKPVEKIGKKEAEKVKESEVLELKKAIETEIVESTKPKKQPTLIAKKKKQEPKVVPKSEQVQAIESILEEDLDEIYFGLPKGLKDEFKNKGEDTAEKINRLTQKTKVKVKDIFKLIIEWLKIIPGVSKFFIEQEAKIKTDKILKTKNKK